MRDLNKLFKMKLDIIIEIYLLQKALNILPTNLKICKKFLFVKLIRMKDK